MSIRLTAEQTWEVLAQAHTGILTTLRSDGSPITLPTWFVALDRTVCFVSPSQTKKVARIRRDPRASFLVESGQRWAELCAVHLSGTIEAVEDESAIKEIDAALDAKYAPFRVAPTEMPESTSSHYASRSFFRLVPESRILTWDNSRIPLTSPT